MSYILDALKKSDQQRQRGATPTLQVAQIAVAAPRRPLFIYYSLLAVVLLGVGIVVGWMHPWQAELMPPEPQPIAAESPMPISQEAAPLPLPAIPEATAGNEVPREAEPLADNAAEPAEGGAIFQNELPLQIQREIPAMDIQLHAYATEPAERLVSINSIRLREGGSLMIGLRLEKITPDGMVFSYKGYRFRRDIR